MLCQSRSMGMIGVGRLHVTWLVQLSKSTESSGNRVKEISAPLAAAGISILFLSTYFADFFLVKERRIQQASPSTVLKINGIDPRRRFARFCNNNLVLFSTYQLNPTILSIRWMRALNTAPLPVRPGHPRHLAARV